RDDLPVPRGRAAEGLRDVRAGGDSRLRGAADGRLRLCVEKGGPRMEVTRQRLGNGRDGEFRARQLAAKAMLAGELEGPELERHVEESLLTTTMERAANWARGNAFMPATFGLACCAIEMMATVGARVDIARFGFEAFRAS